MLEGMILLIDNYDSFVHNLARYFRRLGQVTHVARHDEIEITTIRQLGPAAIVLSPGPCTPAEAGCSLDVVRQLSGVIPILGVCLGHQTIAAALGGRVLRATEPVHGRASPVYHSGRGVFRELPSPFPACRYHSLIVDAATLPACLEITAWTCESVVMGIQHREHATVGVQFHPESILTDEGFQLLANFLRIAGIQPPQVLPRQEQERPPSSPTPAPLPDVPVTF